jgi:hypothetical protein
MRKSTDAPVCRGGDRPRHRRHARWILSLAILAATGPLSGCSMFPTGPLARQDNGEGGFFGWHMQAPFDTSEVKTIFVQFKSQSFRRDLQLMLMESVTKEINMRTPYRCVGTPEQADLILTGNISTDSKNLIVESPTNLPRQLSTTMTVWIGVKHNPPKESEKNLPPTAITETLPFVPEVGQTTLSSLQQVTENIAKQIVDMMEQPWFDESDLQ